MIEFHKKRGVPQNVRSGEDHIWFTDFGTIYVADNEGHPIPMGAGQQVGKSIPVGTPPAPNILYFCTANGKHYLSSNKEWLEIPIKTLPGGPSAPGTAGSVIITDPGDYYSSNDVEGALYELGGHLSDLMGDGVLTELTYNVSKYLDPGNRLLGEKATGRPSNVPSWLNQRKDAAGNIYGIALDADGRAFVRHNHKFTELASKDALDKVASQMAEGIGAAYINAGKGLYGGGNIIDNPTIHVDEDQIKRMFEGFLAQDLPFLKLTGGTLTGDLTIYKRLPEFVLADTKENSRVSLRVDKRRFGIKDAVSGMEFVQYDLDSGVMNLNSGIAGGGVRTKGIFSVSGLGPNYSETSYPFEVLNTGKTNIARFVGSDGTLAIRSFSSYNAIQSTTTNDAADKDLRISGLDGNSMRNFLVNAYEARFSNRVIAGHGMWVAMGHDGYGTGGTQSKYHMFPFHYNPSMPASEARKYFAEMGYNQADHSVMFQAYKKDTGSRPDSWVEQSVSIAASKFVSRSSERYKNVIGEYQEDALNIVREVKPYLYTFKADEKERENLGFIIERGVPEVAVENGGESVDTYALLATLWKAVQELSEEVEELRSSKK